MGVIQRRLPSNSEQGGSFDGGRTGSGGRPILRRKAARRLAEVFRGTETARDGAHSAEREGTGECVHWITGDAGEEFVGVFREIWKQRSKEVSQGSQEVRKSGDARRIVVDFKKGLDVPDPSPAKKRGFRMTTVALAVGR